MTTEILTILSILAAGTGLATVAVMVMENLKLKKLHSQTAERYKNLSEEMQQAVKLQREAIKAGLMEEPDIQHHHTFPPIEASIRKAINILGRLMREIAVALPNNLVLAEAHRTAAQDLRQVASDLKNVDDTAIEVPLTCGFIGGYDNLLKMITDDLLKPIAQLREQEASEQVVRETAIRGLQKIADRLETDANGLEANSTRQQQVP